MQCPKCPRAIFKKMSSFAKHVSKHKDESEASSKSESSEEDERPSKKQQKRKRSDFILWSAEEASTDSEGKPVTSKKKVVKKIPKVTKKPTMKKMGKIKTKPVFKPHWTDVTMIPSMPALEGDYSGEDETYLPPKDELDQSELLEIRKIIFDKGHWIKNSYQNGAGYFTYTEKINDLSRKTIIPILEKAQRWNKFNLLVCLGVLLYNTKDEFFRLFWPSAKNSLFDPPIQKIRSRIEFRKILKNYDPTEVMLKLIYIALATPNYFSRKKYLFGSFKYLNKKNYHLTFFCSIVFSETKNPNTIRDALKLYLTAYPDKKLVDFRGIDPLDKTELNRLCNLYQKAIYIYAPKKAANGQTISIYRCTTAGAKIFEEGKPEYPDVDLFYYKKRYSYIIDIDKFNGEYDCELCHTYYSSPQTLTHHKKKVHSDKIKTPSDKNTKKGYYLPKYYFKQKLRRFGIPEKLLENVQFKHFMVYDIEAALLNKNLDVDFLEDNMCDGKNSYLYQRHQPVCIALASTFSSTEIFNLERYDDVGCVQIVHKFAKAVLKLAHRAKLLYLKDNKILIDFLNELKTQRDDKGDKNGQIYVENILKNIYNYSQSVPILGYNSARYDTQVLRFEGLFIILDRLDPPVKLIRKGGYMKISTPRTLWLDAIKYIGIGFSLRRFIEAFAPEIKERKSYFPYEALDDVKKLENTFFPFYDMFESRLNGINTLEEESRPYLELLKEGLSKDEACKTLKLKTPPQTGRQIYKYLKRIWRTRKMKTWKDLINYYVYYDVKPFKIALLNLLSYFHEKEVDIFKAHCSLSSAAVNMLFLSVETEKYPFFYLDPKNYEHIRRTVHGGLVLCSQRWFDCSGGMKIKEYKYGELALKGEMIADYDFNNLYGGITGAVNHLTGPYVQRDSDNDYNPQWCFEYNNLKNPGCFTWLTANVLGYRIIHGFDLNVQSAYNTSEKSIVTKAGNKYRVDGYVYRQPHNGRPLVLEYYGCMHHAHPKGQCLNEGYDPDEFHPLKLNKIGKKMKNSKVYSKTMKREREIRESGFDVETVWECEWNGKLKSNPNFSKTITDHLIPNFSKTLYISNESQMLECIKNELIYGVVFCSVSVPEYLKDTVYEYPPVFKKIDDFNLDCLPDDSYIKKYCIKYNLQPGKSFLTNVLSGDDLVLPTEVVQYMLAQNYIVSNVRRVLQFGKTDDKPFKMFVDGMVNERREGAASGNTVVANMSKLILNAAVGFTLMKSNLLPSAIICDEATSKKIRRLRPGVSGFEFLGPTESLKEFYGDKKLKDMYLVIAEKNNPPLISNMPVLLGWKVLAMAKLQMLRFMTDARYYFDDAKWTFLYSDTDSIICALAGKDIDECVRDCHKEEWKTKKREIFVTNEPGVCDNYTPLRLKIEAFGDKFACISTKMYCIAGVNEHIIKSAQKGVKLSLNRRLITYDRYKRIILEMGDPPVYSKHVGFLSSYKDDGFWTVQNEKRSFTGLYFKRLVLNNGYWTQPLDWK